MPFLSLEEVEDSRNEVLILHICTFHLSHKGPWERGRLPTPLMLGSSPGQGWWEGNQLPQVGAKAFYSYIEPSVLCLVVQSHPTLCDPMDCSPPGSSVHGDSPGKNTRVGCYPPGDLPNPGIKPRSPTLGAQELGSPRILEWVA